MNTLFLIFLVVAIFAYALLWHNQPGRSRRDEPTAIEAAFAFLLDPYWPGRIVALVARFLAANLPSKWPAVKFQRHGRARIVSKPMTAGSSIIERRARRDLENSLAGCQQSQKS